MAVAAVVERRERCGVAPARKGMLVMAASVVKTKRKLWGFLGDVWSGCGEQGNIVVSRMKV